MENRSQASLLQSRVQGGVVGLFSQLALCCVLSTISCRVSGTSCCAYLKAKDRCGWCFAGRFLAALGPSTTWASGTWTTSQPESTGPSTWSHHAAWLSRSERVHPCTLLAGSPLVPYRVVAGPLMASADSASCSAHWIDPSCINPSCPATHSWKGGLGTCREEPHALALPCAAAQRGDPAYR